MVQPARGSCLSNPTPRIIECDFAPGFMVELPQKDLDLALQEADHLKPVLASTSPVHHLVHSLETRGAGGEGAQALLKVLEQLPGVVVK